MSRNDLKKYIGPKGVDNATSSDPTHVNKITPTFFLPGINLEQIRQDVKAGLFSKIHEEKFPKIVSKKISLGFDKITSDENEEKFCFKDVNGNTVIMVNTNHQEFCNYVDGKPIASSFCQWFRCKKPLSDMKDGPIGIPLSYETFNNYQMKNLTIFHTVGSFCCYQHAFNHLNLIGSRNKWLYQNSENLLRMMVDMNNVTEKLQKIDSYIDYPDVPEIEFKKYNQHPLLITLPKKILIEKNEGKTFAAVPAKLQFFKISNDKNT